MRRSGCLVLLCLLLTALIAGCGGSGEKSESERANCGALNGEQRAECEREAGGKEAGCEKLASELAREGCEKAEVAAQIPTSDRVAYYQLATTAGLLRSDAVAAAEGLPEPSRAGDEEISAARARVAELNPEDPGLRRINRELRRWLRLRAGGLSRPQARRALRALRRIDAELNRYVRHRQPEQAGLVPD